METVVEVGRPNVLKTSSRITSVNMTARKINMMSWKENRAGMNTPLLAISIMPLENSEPMMIPKAATSTIVLRGRPWNRRRSSKVGGVIGNSDNEVEAG